MAWNMALSMESPCLKYILKSFKQRSLATTISVALGNIWPLRALFAHAKLILSPADFESDVGKWTFAFASDPALGKREIASKNEVALLWIKAEMVNAFDTALRVNNDFSTMCLDWFEPGEINHVRHMAGIPESVFLVAMACGFTLHWPSMLDRGNIGFIRYGSAHNLTEEQYFSTFLAFGSSVAARLGSRCGPGCTARERSSSVC
jgi:hypothetical protein